MAELLARRYRVGVIGGGIQKPSEEITARMSDIYSELIACRPNRRQLQRRHE